MPRWPKPLSAEANAEWHNAHNSFFTNRTVTGNTWNSVPVITY